MADRTEASPPRSRHLRARDGQPQVTTPTELFFDLVYVFAITQLSTLVIDDHLGLVSIGRASFLLVVVWWAWIYSTWMANRFDPASSRVRSILAGAALTSLLMSAAIPSAFTSNAVLFAGAYVALQVGRNALAMGLVHRPEPLRPVYERIVAWSCVSGALWIAGALCAGEARVSVWASALAVELTGPFVGYRAPGLGRSQTTDWGIEGGHFAERFQAFVIIALGESIVVSGATASARHLTAAVDAGLTIAFVTTAILWWLYFGRVAENARGLIAHSVDPGRLARDAYTYLHLPIVAGIIMVAIADGLLLDHPTRRLSAAGLAMTVAGPVVYLLGESLVRLRMIGSLSPRRLLAVVALIALDPLAGRWAALTLASAVAAILAALAIVERVRLLS